MFTLLDNNDPSLVQSGILKNFDRNLVKTLLPEEEKDNLFSASILESMVGNSTIDSHNVEKTNLEFEELALEYTENYRMLVEQLLHNEKNPILQKYARKNVKLENSNKYYYINKYGFSQEYVNFGERPLSCSEQAIPITSKDFLKLPKGEDLEPSVECGMEGNNVRDTKNDLYSWIDITGKRFNYPRSVWPDRSESCQQANLINVDNMNLKNSKSYGSYDTNTMCNQYNVEPKLIQNVQILNTRLRNLANELLENIEKLHKSDQPMNDKIAKTQKSVKEKLSTLQTQKKELDKITNETNEDNLDQQNLVALREDTELKVTSNYTKYIVWLSITILLILITIYTVYIDNDSIIAKAIILLVCVYGIYLLFLKIKSMI